MTDLTPEAQALLSIVFRRRRPSQFGRGGRGGTISQVPKNLERVLARLKDNKLMASKESRAILNKLVVKPQLKRRKIDSTRWKAVRYGALKAAGGKCQCCGNSAKDGAALHVDHIKPVSKCPELAYELDNLQVLCADCNIGKLDRDETDWRDK